MRYVVWVKQWMRPIASGWYNLSLCRLDIVVEFEKLERNDNDQNIGTCLCVTGYIADLVHTSRLSGTLQ